MHNLGAQCGDQTKDISIQCLVLYCQVTANVKVKQNLKFYLILFIDIEYCFNTFLNYEKLLLKIDKIICISLVFNSKINLHTFIINGKNIE